MALTSLTAYIDPPPVDFNSSPLTKDGVQEFCRNERGREKIMLNIIIDPNDANNNGEDLTIRLMKSRREKLEEVIQARKTLTLSGAAPTAGGYQLQWDLRDIVYSAENPFCVVRRGDYFFKVEHTGGTTGPSNVSAVTKDFRVTIMTVEMIAKKYLFGSTNRANDDRSVRYQPRKITGVQVVEVSKNHPIDMFPLKLSYNAAAGTKTATLSWRNGEAIEIDTSIAGGVMEGLLDYPLPSDAQEKGYITVRVDPRLLPNVDTFEELLVDRLLIEREVLRTWIDKEAEWLEHDYLYSAIEPALVVSDFDLSRLNVGQGAGTSQAPAVTLPSNFDHDLISTPITYYPPTSGRWINLKVPYWHVRKFEYLIGALENTRIVDIDEGWIHKGASGYVTLVPFNQSLAYNFIGLMRVHALRGVIELPSFWRYRYWSGIPDVNRRVPQAILDVIGLRASVEILTVLGQAFRGGFSSQSATADGKSESVTYTASATFGIYSATIEENKKRLKPLEKQIKKSYYGTTLMAL